MTSTYHAVPSSESIATQMATLRREELGRDIAHAAYRRSGSLHSADHQIGYLFDKFLFETRPTILRPVASLVAECLPSDVDRIGGVELGGVPLAVAVSLETGLPFIVICNDANSSIGGECHSGERLTLIDAVTRSGAKVQRAAQTVQERGAVVSDVVAVVDCEAGGADRIASAGYHYQALFRLSELAR